MITLDAHIDTPWQFTKRGRFDLRVQSSRNANDVDFGRMQDGGLQAAFFALYLSESLQDEVGPKGADELIDKQFDWIRGQDGCSIVYSARSAIRSLRNRNVPIFLGLEGGRLIHNSLDRLRQLSEEMCVRYLTLTHNRDHEWASSATGTADKPLTEFGKKVVRRCEQLGILVDVSHTSDETCISAIVETSKPIIASHSGCRSLVNHPRNLSDWLIKEIACTGGVIHIPFARRFVETKEGVADHIEHVMQLTGSHEHVGIGSDLDGAALAPGITDVSNWASTVIEPLIKRGYSEEVIAAVAGGNTLRLL